MKRIFLSLVASSCIAVASNMPVYAEHHEGGHDQGHHEGHGEMASKDIVDTAVAAGSFTTLVAAVKAAGLVEVLKGDGPYTVFAPTDEAFAKIPAESLEALLLPENKDQLVAVLTYHVVPGKVMAADIVGKSLMVESVEGSKISVDATSNVMVDNANVIKTDIVTSNGVIHVIDTVIFPGS
mgnify:CR=1 FL=1